MLSLTSRIHEHCEKGNRSIAISKRKQLPGKEYTEMQVKTYFVNYGSIAHQNKIYLTKNNQIEATEMVNISKDLEKKSSLVRFYSGIFPFFFFSLLSFCSLLCAFSKEEEDYICFVHWLPHFLFFCSSVLNKL